MYSKEQTRELKNTFWTSFSEAYPKKWLLHKTKIKDFSFKFYADNKKIEVMLAIESKDEELKKIYFQKIESLQTLLREDYLPEVLLDEFHQQENGKIIAKVWVEKTGIGFHDKNNWSEIFDYFNQKMELFEAFYYEYEDYIKDLEMNT
ncbi:MAG TPA: DUF4268 domain-containing protein [Flavobacterium sp.]|nr:DUF4268 domain-containing protein [Flavobacterium sp.]